MLDAGVYSAGVVAAISGLIFFSAWLTLMRDWIRTGKRPGVNPVYMMKLLSFVATFLFVGFLSAHGDRLAQNDARDFLAALPTEHQVLVNGQTVENPDAVLAALRSLSSGKYHHSKPINRIRVEIRTRSRSLDLFLGRDSEYANEYWVYSARYRVTKNSPIGKITTLAFDGYY